MELELQPGWIAPELAEEFPELGLDYAELDVLPGRTSAAVKQRLRDLSNRYTGGKVIHMRQDPIPWAYRVFYRQIGIDPDTDRTPAERVAVERLEHGAFRSQNNVDDALTIAIAETGVPLIALDGDKLTGAPGLRLADEGEQLSPIRPLSSRQIVVADAERALAILFGDIAEDAGVTPKTRRMVLVALGVKGVPRISIEEAVWLASETMQAVE